MTDVTGSTLGAAAEGTEQAMETVAFPIEGYDEINVDEISGRLNEGTAAGSRLRGTQREAPDAPGTDGPQDKDCVKESRRSPLRGRGRPTVLALSPIFAGVGGREILRTLPKRSSKKSALRAS